MRKLFRWVSKERININDIEIFNPTKELYLFGSYSLFYLLIVFLFSLLIKFYPLPILNAVSFTYDFWYVFIIKILFLLYVPLYIYRKLGYNFRSVFQFKFNKTLSNISVSILFLILGLYLNFPHLLLIINKLTYIDKLLFLKILAAGIIPFIAAALPEEIFYRIILQTRLERKTGWFYSIILSSFMFSLFHLPSRLLLASGVEGTAGDILSITKGTIIPVFVAGLILGFLWNRYRNIYLLLTFHYGVDLLPTLSSFLGIKY